LHNTAGLTLAVFMAFWTVYYVMVSQRIATVYFPTAEDLKHGLLRQAFYYFFNYFRGRPNPFHATPENKFNALQKLAYLVIMFFFMPLVSITGVLLLDLESLRTLMFNVGGIKLIDGIHFLSACCLCAFVCTHFYLTTLGPTPLSEIRTMWTGWEKEAKPEQEQEK
jgi:thiosulfate reductase cytochrome b subunit